MWLASDVVSVYRQPIRLLFSLFARKISPSGKLVSYAACSQVRGFFLRSANRLRRRKHASSKTSWESPLAQENGPSMNVSIFLGIWIRDIRYKSNLQLTQVNKILKTLESKKLIKAIKSVAVRSFTGTSRNKYAKKWRNSLRFIPFPLAEFGPDENLCRHHDVIWVQMFSLSGVKKESVHVV
jgi:hypothetical protein